MNSTTQKERLDQSKPILYLITNGATTARTTPASEEFRNLIALVRGAVHARIDLVQLREKQLPARTLYRLAALAAEITRGTGTRLLINDRADIAHAGGADGVHLTTRSLDVTVVRRTFGDNLLVGVSTHSIAEADAARRGGADFAVFGPVFKTQSKPLYGLPHGLGKLGEAARALAPFPLIALGGVTLQNAYDALRAGAAGIAAIGLFSDQQKFENIVREIKATEANAKT